MFKTVDRKPTRQRRISCKITSLSHRVGKSTIETLGEPINKIFTVAAGDPIPPAYPIVIRLKDDEQGESKFFVDQLIVPVNSDDNDANGVADHLDIFPSSTEDDLVEFDLTDIIANIPSGRDGALHVAYSLQRSW